MLAGFRNRCARALDELQALLKQLAAQAEVVRLVGMYEPAMRKLAARAEGLDQLLAEEAPLA